MSGAVEVSSHAARPHAAPGARLSHVGICVTDLERSTRFYCDAFGFTLGTAWRRSDGATSVDPLDVACDDVLGQYLELEGATVELLWFAGVDPLGPRSPRPMNQLGLTHLTMIVDDLDIALDRVRDAGSSVLEHTRMEFELPHAWGGLAFCLDPDGTRIEINCRHVGPKTSR